MVFKQKFDHQLNHQLKWSSPAKQNCLVGGFNLPTPLKNDGVRWDDYSIPIYEMEHKKIFETNQ